MEQSYSEGKAYGKAMSLDLLLILLKPDVGIFEQANVGTNGMFAIKWMMDIEYDMEHP